MTARQHLDHERLARQSLEWLIEMGADELIGEHPVNLLTPKEPTTPAPLEPEHAKAALRPRPPAPRPVSSQGPIADAAGLAAACADLEQIRDALRHFDTCPLQRTATNLVFYDGNPKARVMFTTAPLVA